MADALRPLHLAPMKEDQPMPHDHFDAHDTPLATPSEHLPWYIIVSKLSLALGTSLAMLTGG